MRDGHLHFKDVLKPDGHWSLTAGVVPCFLTALLDREVSFTSPSLMEASTQVLKPHSTFSSFPEGTWVVLQGHFE